MVSRWASLALALSLACAAPGPSDGPSTQPSATDTAQSPAAIGASFTLTGDSGDPSTFEWSPPTNHVFCRWYPEPERGDYVWIRFGQTPEQDGDAGPRLDIDVCRLTTGGGALYAPMSAGEHGSHCAAEPGFAIWWHEGEHAFNNGNAAQSDRCMLELDVDTAAGMLSGKFSCEPLEAAAHSDASASEPPPSGRVQVTDGRFTCTLDRMPPE